MQFTPGKKYALDGATLQQLWDAVATSQILPSDEYELEVTPKKGTRLKDIKSVPYIPRWDLIPAEDGKFKLYAPAVSAAYGSSVMLEFDNVAITLSADSWVVAKITDLGADPYEFATELAAAEVDGSLKVYQFDGSDNLSVVRLPLWYISSSESAGAKRVGEFWATKHVGDTIQTLGSMHVVVPSRPISKPVPRLIPV